jgi:hypothetical protein
MNEQSQIRPRRPQRTTAAVLALLAILIAPVCAPLCAAKHCAPGARLEQCHETATTENRDGDNFVAPAKDCGQADFSAVLVKAEEYSPLERGARSDLAPTPIRLSHVNAIGTLQANPARWGIHQVPLELPDFLPLTTVLRI